uniref:Uncharacterized protein n=1 Tax=Candidatus Nitrotoga fabula TaxID=2182327 RepID=A0A2X0QSH3_9PROT|nr:protein of unknown function [Candidatus Nitrotoga fabula]
MLVPITRGLFLSLINRGEKQGWCYEIVTQCFSIGIKHKARGFVEGKVD